MNCWDCEAALSETAQICMVCGAYQAHSIRPALAPTIQAGALVAEYTAGKAPSGEWYALGSVHESALGTLRPATILVGAGASHDTALDSLRQELARVALRE